MNIIFKFAHNNFPLMLASVFHYQTYYFIKPAKQKQNIKLFFLFLFVFTNFFFRNLVPVSVFVQDPRL